MRSPRTLTVLSLTALVLGGLVALPASAVSLHRGRRARRRHRLPRLA